MSNQKYQKRIFFENEHGLIRGLNEEDYDRGFFELMNQLVKSEKLSKEEYLEILYDMTQDSLVGVYVDKKQDKILGSFKLLFEKKFIIGGCLCCYLEDVVVDENSRNKGIGKAMMDVAINFCKERKCHRITGMADDTNIGFYLACGFDHDGKGVQIHFK